MIGQEKLLSTIRMLSLALELVPLRGRNVVELRSQNDGPYQRFPTIASVTLYGISPTPTPGWDAS